MSSPFDTITILPSYEVGFTFLWTISPGFDDPFPWKFHVEEGHTDTGPWEDISGELEDVYAYMETRKRVLSTKDAILFYRVTLTTPDDTYESHVKTPYGDLNRREYLIVQDLMRRVVLEQRVLAGVPVDLYIKAAWGSTCEECRDPISGDILDSKCDYCMGTGRRPAYHGPYGVYGTLSTVTRDKQAAKTGPKQQYTRQMRMTGFPSAKDDDIVVDPATDKRYIVDGVQQVTEIRTIPVIQSLQVHELPVSDIAYKLGA